MRYLLTAVLLSWSLGGTETLAQAAERPFSSAQRAELAAFRRELAARTRATQFRCKLTAAAVLRAQGQPEDGAVTVAFYAGGLTEVGFGSLTHTAFLLDGKLRPLRVVTQIQYAPDSDGYQEDLFWNGTQYHYSRILDPAMPDPVESEAFHRLEAASRLNLSDDQREQLALAHRLLAEAERPGNCTAS